jgi:hypothetical protein
VLTPVAVVTPCCSCFKQMCSFCADWFARRARVLEVFYCSSCSSVRCLSLAAIQADHSESMQKMLLIFDAALVKIDEQGGLHLVMPRSYTAISSTRSSSPEHSSKHTHRGHQPRSRAPSRALHLPVVQLQAIGKATTTQTKYI